MSQQLVKQIPFIDLKTQQNKIYFEIDAAIKRVLEHGTYIMGPEVTLFENQLSKFCGVRHVISCASGTDALMLALMAKNVGSGHAVFVPSFTFAATAEVVVLLGATPIFVDVLRDTFNMDVASLKLAIETAKKLHLKPKGIIPVDLFGQPADYEAIDIVAKENNLWVLADAAQSFGASYQGKKTGSMGDLVATSFFPAKPLGCYGDGGAVFTNDDELAHIIKSLRVHGQGADKYDNVRIGINGRLDTIQAAILLEKLKIFPEEIIIRNTSAKFYSESLDNSVIVPTVIHGSTSVWAQYTIRLPCIINRVHFINELKKVGIPTVIYYVKPLHQQAAYETFPTAGQKDLPASEQLAKEVLSLPISGYIKPEDLAIIVGTINHLIAEMEKTV